MSYTFDIIDRPSPATYEEAVAVRDALAAEQETRVGASGAAFDAPSPRMRELHDRLVARFPCITIDDDGPWSDGPLINDFGRDLATLGLVYSRVEEVLPFVIATANGMGFWVLDCQDEVLHLPDGTRRPSLASLGIVPRDERRWWEFWK